MRDARPMSPFQQFHHQVLDPILIADVVEGADMRMAQTGDRTRLSLESFPESGAASDTL